MGKNGRMRRAAKQRERRERVRTRSAHRPRRADQHGSADDLCSGPSAASAPGADDQHDRRSRSGPDDAALIAELAGLLPGRWAHGHHRWVGEAIDTLLTRDRRLVLATFEHELRRVIGAAWAGGWQPIELVRQGRRAAGLVGEGLLASAVVAHHHAAGLHVDDRWRRQIEVIAGDQPPASTTAWLGGWTIRAGLSLRDALMLSVKVLAAIGSLPRLEVLIPPPGASTISPAGVGATSTRLSDDEQQVLARVRHLLAKAESTEFDAEAETFTAKAQELLTRHAIDAALLMGPCFDGSAQIPEPMSIRVPIDDPYADAKSLLLQVVAAANRCRTVAHSGIGLSTVVGFPSDVSATELLHASLLVQAQTSLSATGRTAPAGTRTRSRSYRSAFLVGFAHRIEQRLAEINAHLVAEAESGGRSALPALRTLADRVDDVITERFPGLHNSRVRAGWDPTGWVGGRDAADRARLNLADLEAG